MANILFGWELGANLGHVAKFLPLAQALRARGHAITWALSQTGAAARVIDRAGFAWLQAPVFPERRHATPPVSYADILARFGYGDAADLLGLTVAWRELLRLTNARLLLADHAPTALLAARTLDLPAMLFSTGFCVPPTVVPTPAMRAWAPAPPERLAAIEQPVLNSIDTVLARFGKPPLGGVARLFDVAENALMGFRELDHYPGRAGGRYWGDLTDAGVGIPPPWPELPGKRLFAYLRRETRHLDALLAALRALAQPTVIFFPGAPAALLKKHAAPHLAYVDTPIDLARTGREADAAITYASLSTTTRFLLAGKPLLLLPGHLEQFLLARRVAKMGAGVLVAPDRPAADLPDRLRRVLDDPQLAANARGFARKYAALPQEVVIGNLVRRIEELCP